ncbi:eukaryotic translation initiation factor 4 gamma 1a isoform X2 [Megalops cyprinoides]|uniref:eukaryotic translation initiation factor 4 gamma 1a isoform X2 n=1 Tax=Megalops cyprinoides TaxID=118141 RepID=UPI001863DD4D|nr:eukaryotic translation initiation factor 4 gamma 1a isoform X2 [Megalops cyprinoides]
MNKVPQQIATPPSAPHPAPSPGLLQTAFPPGQPTGVVFATPSAQMNAAPQPRQQYYQNRPGLPGASPRVQTSSAPRPVGPTHVFQPGTQMMMIPQQQLSFGNSQNPAYLFPPAQYRSTYVATAQQYQLPSGTPGFYPGSSPAEYGAYYSAQGQYSPAVPAAPVIMNAAQPQPTPPQQQMQPKRERKQIRIRDPNQGGRDITEEIMSGVRTGSTPTPPQSAVSASEGGSHAQVNGESALPAPTMVRPDDGEKSLAPAGGTPTPPPSRSPAPVSTAPPADESQPDTDSKVSTHDEVPVPPGETPGDTPTIPSVSPASDRVDTHTPPPASVSPPAAIGDHAVTIATTEQPPAPEVDRLQQEEEEKERAVREKAKEQESVDLAVVEADPGSTPIPVAMPTNPPCKAANGVSAELPESSTMPEGAAEPQTAPLPELQLPNGHPPLAQQDPEGASEDSPVAETEVAQPQDTPAMPTPDVTPDTTPHVPIEEQRGTPPLPTSAPAGETSMQAAVSVPKKRKKLKDLNRKEAVGDLLDAFKEEQVVESAPESKLVQAEKEEPSPALASDGPHPATPAEETPAAKPTEEPDETWEEKEDKLDAGSVEPEAVKPTDLKYQYKEEEWKPLNPEAKKTYDREFLLGFQFISISMHKPEGLPTISDVVLDKANKLPLRPPDPGRMTGMNCGPDFTPSFANLGRQSSSSRGPPSGMSGPRRSQQGPRKEPRKIIASVSLNEDIKLNKAEKAWKPALKKQAGAEERGEEDPEVARTQELFRRVRSILNKLTPQMFQQLMKQVTELTVDTEERLKGVIDLIFEKAISEPNFSVAYANMCRCLMGLKVPTADKQGVTVNFRKLLLNRCQKEFEKDKDNDEIFEKKQKELEATTVEEERQRLKEELEEAKDKARRRSLGNIKFIGELFKLKMLTEAIMHDCVVKLLKNHDEESLECLCRLLSTIGKDLDFEKAKPRMDQYFNQMEKIIKERKTSSRIRFMLQDVLDLRRNNWVPRRGDQGPKTIDQIHKEAELEEHREQIKVQQQLLSKKDTRMGGGGGGGGGRAGPHPMGGRGSQPQEEGWNTVPISKNRPIDPSRLTKITKPGALDLSNQLLAPGGKGSWGSWGKGSSGGSGSKPSGESAPETGRPTTSTLNRFSALQQPSSSAPLPRPAESERRVPQRSSSSRDRGERGDRSERPGRGGGDHPERREDRGSDRQRPPVSKRSYSRETEQRGAGDSLRRVSSMTDERDRHGREAAERGSASMPPPAPAKPAMSEDELEKKSKAIIEEFLHINDMKEALQCVQETNSTQLLFVFVRNGVESTLERSTIAREHMGLLLHQLLKAGTLPPQQYYKGLQEILEVAEDMAIDIPHIWLYLAEIITPMLNEGGIPMGQLFREVSKPLVPQGKAAVLLVEILSLLCKGMSHKKAGLLWREAGLSWKDFLPEDEDVNKFVTEKKVEFTLGEASEKPSKVEMSSEELCRRLDKLMQENVSNQSIFDWVEANLDKQQINSNLLVRALMTSVCRSAIIGENPYKVNPAQIKLRAKLLQKYLTEEQKELQALYALQALMVKMEQPANLLRMFFDTLYDEDVIKEEAFYKWESSKDPAEQQGKGVALKSVTAFFTWLREAEEESDNS